MEEYRVKSYGNLALKDEVKIRFDKVQMCHLGKCQVSKTEETEN